ncbi:hypothetical protein [Xanthomonas translucens]|uniref:hypothetical protein n=1 Tax=Xanthomonas campestris pv. translucens TaxID=343 RepID=UPI0009B9F68B|nr:hypothetical protein [Xanthomonas translucens]WNJ31831.1 hypothetical protein RMA82_05265 [Xanthomonas translucens pv. undulosa]
MNELNKIKFAFYLNGWSYEDGLKAHLRDNAVKIPPLEFVQEMKGHIFCPECSAPLFRSPENKDYSRNGRRAFFAHARGIQTDCGLRVKQTDGKRYENEEEAKKAMEDRELVVVQSFMHERPETPQINGPLVYDREPNEYKKGPLAVAPIGRHNGEEFKLPSKITTVRGLCRSFDENLNKYFLLPGQRSARTLREQLIPVSDVKATCEAPRLYVGRITDSKSYGLNPWNLRLTFLEFINNSEFKDFCLKETDETSKEHGIDNESKGRIALAYGEVTESGIGLCIANLGWGEFALLPQKYDRLLDL